MALCTKEPNLTAEDIKLKNINYLKECYEKYIRNDFLESFEGLFCKSSMNDPFLNKILKTYCCHEDTKKEINFKHYELMMYVTNIIAWLDSKMNYYNNDPTTRSISKDESFKACNSDGNHVLKSHLDYKRIETSEKNELPIVTFFKHQNHEFPSKNGSKRCHEGSEDFSIINSQDSTIFTDLQISNVDPDDHYENKTAKSLTNNSTEENIDLDDNSMINNESLINNYKEKVNKVTKDFSIGNSQGNTTFTDIQIKNLDNFENKKRESLSNKLAEENVNLDNNSVNNDEKSLINNYEEEINKVSKDFVFNNLQDDVIFTGIQIKNVDSNDNFNNKKGGRLTSNFGGENINPDDNPKKNNENLTKNPEEDINKIFKNLQNNISFIMETSMKNIDSEDISNSTNKENINTSVIISDIEEITSNPKSLINNVSVIIEKKLDPFQSTTDNGNSENILDVCLETSSKTDEQNFNCVNKLSDIKPKFHRKSKKILNNSFTKKKRCNLAIIDSEYTSKKKKMENLPVSHATQNNHDAKKLDPVQSTTDNGNSENILNVCLETSSKTDEQNFNCVNKLSDIKPKFHKKSKNILNDSSTKKKICNPIIIDSEYTSKKTKMENLPVSHATQNNHDVSNLVKTSNDSTKKVDKNMYCRNSKGETKLHAACAKGKLDLVAMLLANGFNPNVKDNAGWTPLHEAVKNGHYFIVKKLIDYGAYLNVPGFEYESPLYTSVKYGKFDIALMLFQNGADIKYINMYGINALSLNEEKCSQLIKNQIQCVPPKTKYVYEYNQIIVFMYKVSLKNAIVEQFCQQFNIKLVHNILNEKEVKQVTHIILPETEKNVCDISMEILIGIANGLFVVNQRWMSDSLKKKKLLSCENYEVSGTANFIDYNGPKMSRINKQNLCPKLFDGICIYISGTIGWESFSLDQLKKLVLAFGAKLLKRMPNPEDCPTNIIPYHCRDNKEMYHVSTIILYTMDSTRLIKYNMKHLKTFHISWFMKAVQEYTIL